MSMMDPDAHIGQIAALIGEPARARMLWRLLDGRAFTATELAMAAEVSPQSASSHLNKLIRAELLTVEVQGRHRYYTFFSPEVAYVIEAVAGLLPPGKTRDREQAPRNGQIRYCRTCYDHLAGMAGVALTDSLVKERLLIPEGSQYTVTAPGAAWFKAMGIDIDALKERKRAFARQCLDWSERRHHLAGSLGAALLEKMLADDWLRRTKHSRAIVVTATGERKFQDLLGLSFG